MLDQEPFVYPSRQRFVMDPAIPDRQLWAIGMIVVQWSHVESWIEMSTRHLVKDDPDAVSQYDGLRNFKQKVDFWQTQLELKSKDPYRAYMLSLVPRVRELSSQRDYVVHRLWAGGMEGTSPAAAGLETADAGMMPNLGEKIKKTRGELIPFTWHATFNRLRQMAREMAALNNQLLSSLFQPNAPHGYVDTGSKVNP